MVTTTRDHPTTSLLGPRRRDHYNSTSPNPPRSNATRPSCQNSSTSGWRNRDAWKRSPHLPSTTNQKPSSHRPRDLTNRGSDQKSAAPMTAWTLPIRLRQQGAEALWLAKRARIIAALDRNLVSALSNPVLACRPPAAARTEARGPSLTNLWLKRLPDVNVAVTKMLRPPSQRGAINGWASEVCAAAELRRAGRDGRAPVRLVSLLTEKKRMCEEVHTPQGQRQFNACARSRRSSSHACPDCGEVVCSARACHGFLPTSRVSAAS